MRSRGLVNERIISRVTDILEQCSEKIGIKIASIVLFGSRVITHHKVIMSFDFWR